MSKYYSIPIRIVSIITLIAFVFTQAAWGYEDYSASSQPQKSHIRAKQFAEPKSAKSAGVGDGSETEPRAAPKPDPDPLPPAQAAGADMAGVDKAAQRGIVKARLEKINHQRQIAQKSRRIIKNVFMGLPDEIECAAAVMFYYPMDKEVQILPLIEYAFETGKIVVLPRIELDSNGENVIVPYAVTNLLTDGDGADLETGPYGIPQPKGSCRRFEAFTSKDVVFFPGIAFDKEGRRLGRGKAYYDRFANDLDTSVLKVAVAFNAQLLAKVASSDHDVHMDVLITESGIYRNGSKTEPVMLTQSGGDVASADMTGPVARLPIDVKVETIGEPEVVISPDPASEKHILNPAGLFLNGWRCLFPRRAIEGIVSEMYPRLSRSEIGCYVYNPDAKDFKDRVIVIDKGMLRPDDPLLVPLGEGVTHIAALEDARAVEYNGTIYLILTIVKKDSTFYLAVTTHDTKGFIRNIQGKMNNPQAALQWHWSRLERVVKDGPHVNDDVKSAVMIGAPSSDGTFTVLYRPTKIKGYDGPLRFENDPRRFIRRLVSKNLNGPWHDGGVYMEETRWGSWIGPSAYVSGAPQSITGLPLEFLLFHTGTGDYSESNFKYYQFGLIVADRDNLNNKIVIEPIHVPAENSEEGWVNNVIYTDCGFFTECKQTGPETFELLMEIYYGENDTRIGRMAVKITVTYTGNAITGITAPDITDQAISQPVRPYVNDL